MEIWPPGRWKREGKAKPAIQVITGSEAAKPAIPESGGHPNFNLNPNPENLSTKGKATATSKPAIAVITDFGVGLSGKESENSKAVGSASNCEPYRELIELGLSRDRNAMAIWQDLVSDYGFQGGYQSVRRFAYKLRGAQVPHARAVILTAPGEEGQVDYGSGPMVREPKSGKYRRTRLFVLTLGYSRKAVRLLVFRSSTRIWAELHEKAFRRLGGVPRILVLDNLREGVLVPHVYDATLNPLYRDVLAHYGARRSPLPHPGSRSKRKSRAQCRTHQKHAAQGKTLRELGGRASLSGSLGNELGGYAHSRHHETASGCHVRRRKTNPAPAAGRTVSLLPVRRTGGASGWLCRSRSRVLRSTARLDRTRGESPMG